MAGFCHIMRDRDRHRLVGKATLQPDHVQRKSGKFSQNSIIGQNRNYDSRCVHSSCFSRDQSMQEDMFSWANCRDWLKASDMFVGVAYQVPHQSVVWGRLFLC